jgi:transcriptional repressor NrdR
VLESRKADEGAAVRRRRRCSACGQRFTTFERYERGLLYVRKRDGERQPFDRAKLRSGLARAAHKRPVPAADLDAIADRIEAEAERVGGELPAERVGEICLDGLRRLDRVSYLQFAAVYRQLDVDDVRAELARLAREPGPLPEENLLGDSEPEFAASGTGSVRPPSDPA